jgi:hypothetical protein
MKPGRRYKSYQGETGVFYQYFFEASRRVERPEGQGPGSDYLFVVTADQRPPFALKVCVSRRAQEAWRAAHGRELDLREEYAAAKMRLFRAFDESEDLSAQPLALVVDDSNVEELLAPLELD